jgi:short-subunit dehydrogenase involved in D-alanine esterification of teichoic acids
VCYTLAFALQLRKKHRKTSVRVVEKFPDIPEAAVQSTSTHKQHTEYRERNMCNNNKEKKKIGKCGSCPIFASYTLAFALQLRKKHRKTSVRVVEKGPDILVAAVQYTFTHKQHTEYTEQNIHNNKKEKKLGSAGCARLCELYPGICLTTEEKAQENLS